PDRAGLSPSSRRHPGQRILGDQRRSLLGRRQHNRPEPPGYLPHRSTGAYLAHSGHGRTPGRPWPHQGSGHPELGKFAPGRGSCARRSGKRRANHACRERLRGGRRSRKDRRRSHGCGSAGTRHARGISHTKSFGIPLRRPLGRDLTVNTLLLQVGLLAAQFVDAGSEPVALSPEISDSGAVDGGSRERVWDASEGRSQDGARFVHLTGQVLAKGSRDPIAAAQVAVQSAPRVAPSTETDSNGQFDMAVECGPQTFVIREPGYEPFSVRRDPCADPAPLLVRLVRRPNLPSYETVVTAERDEPSNDLHGPELTSTPGSLGDPFRTIESLPGVAAVAWPAPIYVICGFKPGNTGYFLNHLQVPQLFRLALEPSVIHPHIFDSMAFYPGGYPARYGRYVAGVVSAQPRAPAEDRTHGEAEIRLYDAGGMFSMPWPDHQGGVALAFRYSYAGALLSLLQNDVRISYWDYQ